MSIEAKELDFRGQEFFIGLDVHKRNWKVCIRVNGIELKRFSMDPNPESLCDYLKRHYPGGSYNSVYEAGFCGYWIHRRLEDLGIRNRIVNAADVPTTHKEKITKSDRVDAGKLSRELESGSLKGIYVPSEYHQQLYSLTRLRRKQSIHQVRLKTRIKSYLHFMGIEMPLPDEMSHWSGAFITWLKGLQFSHPQGKAYLEQSIIALEEERFRISQTIRQLRRIIRESEANRLVNDYLCSIPGIGFITAVNLYSELASINRFPRLDELCAYVGIIPSVSSSDETIIQKGITPRRNRHLRHAMIESAWVAVRKDPAMTLAFNKLTIRMSKQHAIIRITKKLLNRVRYVWKNECRYQKGMIQ